MPGSTSTASGAAGTINEFVSTALSQTGLDGLTELLRFITRAMDAYACFLWQLAPGANLDASPPEGRLFVLAHWLPENKLWTSYDLSLNSASGHALINSQTVNVFAADSDFRTHEPRSFFAEHSIKTFCSVPVVFADNARGVITVYRVLQRSFTESEVSQLCEFASLLPQLYQSIRDKVSFALITRVEQLLRNAERETIPRALPGDKLKELLAAVCSVIRESFQSIETSLFLEDRVESPGTYQLMATTVPWSSKVSYSKETPGLTGWVLAGASPVRIFDLTHFKNDLREIHREYPGLSWDDSLDVSLRAREILQRETDSDLPPNSFMAAPVMLGNEVLGVLRCSTAVRAPYYFADRELSLLSIVASQIGQFWTNWTRRREAEDENRTWRALVASLSDLNRFALQEFARPAPEVSSILTEALRVVAAVIRGAEVTDVRLLDSASNELYFAATHGAAWQQGPTEEVDRRRAARFRIESAPESPEAIVLKTRDSYSNRELPLREPTFPGMSRLIIAPISSHDRVFGVLDIRGRGGHFFPDSAQVIAELIGQQLGLYYYLALTIGELHQVDAELKEVLQVQTMTYESLGHELKSPVTQAQARLEAMLRNAPLDGPATSQLRRILGLVRKARRVSLSIRLFADLAAGKEIQLQLTDLQPQDLLKMLIEAGSDFEVLLGADRRVTFEVERKGVDKLGSHCVRADLDLLRQAVSNVLDNAFKYSFPGSSIRVHFGASSGGSFYIGIINRGLQLKPSEVHSSKQKGWRSPEAQWTTGEGSGIGLWIVDHIMKAHGGELLVAPTNEEGLTEVKLLFPSIRR